MLSLLLALGLSVGQPARPPEVIKGKVLDVFDDNRVLISFGKDKDAQKGMRVEVYRAEPKAEYVGTVELLEVGAKHSFGRFVGKVSRQVRENDTVSWRSGNAAAERQPTPDFGGAIIDLTKPKK